MVGWGQVMDWTLLYPFINDGHAAYSTNHLEVGEHIKVVDDKDHRREHYEHPLLQKPPPELTHTPTLRLDHLYNEVAATLEQAQIQRIRLRDLPPTGCNA